MHVLPREDGPRIPGRCRVLFTHGNLDITSMGPEIWLHASDYGGSWKNSYIFLVKVNPDPARHSSLRNAWLCVSLGAFGRLAHISYAKGELGS